MKLELSIVTFSIIEPPVRTGGIASRSSLLPQSAPTPVGPSILCEEKTAKSTPKSRTLIGMCALD